MIYLIIILVIPVLSFYWFFTKKYSYWSDRGINGPKPWPFMGNLIEMFLTSRRKTEMQMINKYGKIYGIFNGTAPVLTIADPELVKNILVKDFHIFTNREMLPFFANHPILSKHLGFVSGHDWKRIRSIVSPTFTSGKMRRMFPLVNKCMDQMSEVLDKHAKDDKTVDVKQLFANYSMDAIATCAFATNTNVYNDPNDPFVVNATEVFSPKTYRLIPILLLPNFVLKLMNLKFSSNEWANQFFFDLTRHVIKERNNSDEKHNDFIQLLLNVQKNVGSDNVVNREDTDITEAHHLNEGKDELEIENKVLNEVTNKFITEDEILAQSWAFFSAAFDNTTSTLTYASYELALNPDIQQRVYEEVMTAVDSDGHFDYDKLSKLKFLDCIVSETLRLHTPAIRLTRKASEDYKLGDTGITIEKDQSIEIPIYAIHHLEEFYENPFEFDPDRFMPENSHKLIPYTYLPFGSGPRNCVGMRFTLMQIKVCLAQLLRKFRLFRIPQTEVPIVFRDTPGVNAPKHLFLGIEKRFGS